MPAFFKEGRYVVKNYLGDGATKRVYLVHDTLLDRDVAFAQIKTDRLDEIGRPRIIREAQTMGRLGDHPNVVQIYDLGNENGQPYLVMPVLTGGHVDQLLRKAKDHRLPMDECLSIARDVCRCLDFTHQKNVIHRDLKPGNVWLTADGVAKIGDFGLAITTDQSRLTQHNMVVGTLWYMAPEQAMGGEVGTHSDLYSLGSLIYHMVTSRPPFLGEDSASLIGQHVNTPPVAPTWHNPECPKPLEELILKLLSKDPADRPASAADVLKTLESIDTMLDAGAGTEAGSNPDSSGTWRDQSLFVGRKSELKTLKQRLEDTLSGKSGLVTLVGESGIGKTRMAGELATYATLRGATVLWGRCYRHESSTPYAPWVRAIRSYMQKADSESLLTEMGQHAWDISEIVPEIRGLVSSEIEPPAGPETLEEARDPMVKSVTAFTKGMSLSRPLVVILDDVHLAARPSLALLHYMASSLPTERILLIATHEEVSPEHPVKKPLDDLANVLGHEQISLTGFSKSDVAEFIDRLAPVKPPQAFAAAIHTQTAGNPLFVSELVRMLAQKGELTETKLLADDGWNERLPRGVGQTISQRIAGLSDGFRPVMSVAAVIGPEFDQRHLYSILGDMDVDRLAAVLNEARIASVIEEVQGTKGRHRFTHARVQQALMSDVPAVRQTELHAKFASTIEEEYGKQAEDYASQLAYHYDKAEPIVGPKKLIWYSLLAGEKALAAYAFEEAMAHFEKALVAKYGAELDEETEALVQGLSRAHAARANSE